MKRFITTRYVPMKITLKKGEEGYEEGGKNEKEVQVAEGYWIGPGDRSITHMKPGHFGKQESYYRRPNTLKKDRINVS